MKVSLARWAVQRLPSTTPHPLVLKSARNCLQVVIIILLPVELAPHTGLKRGGLRGQHGRENTLLVLGIALAGLLRSTIPGRHGHQPDGRATPRAQRATICNGCDAQWLRTTRLNATKTTSMTTIQHTSKYDCCQVCMRLCI